MGPAGGVQGRADSRAPAVRSVLRASWGGGSPGRAPRVPRVTWRRRASLALEAGSRFLRPSARQSCAIRNCRGAEGHSTGLHPEVYDACSPEAPPSRAPAPPGGARSSGPAAPVANTSLPRPKGSRPSGPAPCPAPSAHPESAHASSSPPARRSPPLPQASGRAAGGAWRAGAGPALLRGARPGLVGFGGGGGGGSRERRDKAASRPGYRRGDWAGGSVASRSAEGIGAPLPCNRSAARRAASSSLGFPGPATPGPLSSARPRPDPRFHAVRVQDDAGKRVGVLGPGRGARKYAGRGRGARGSGAPGSGLRLRSARSSREGRGAASEVRAAALGLCSKLCLSD